MENIKTIETPNEELIDESNLFDFYEQDMKGMEKILEEFNIDLTPDPIHTQKPKITKICRCGNNLFESPQNEFRCSNCGNILYTRRSD